MHAFTVDHHLPNADYKRDMGSSVVLAVNITSNVVCQTTFTVGHAVYTAQPMSTLLALVKERTACAIAHGSAEPPVLAQRKVIRGYRAGLRGYKTARTGKASRSTTEGSNRRDYRIDQLRSFYLVASGASFAPLHNYFSIQYSCTIGSKHGS